MQHRIQDFPWGEDQLDSWAPTYYLAQICRKLHENENKMDREGVSSPKFYYVDSTTGIRKRRFIIFKFLIVISKQSDATSQVTSHIVSRPAAAAFKILIYKT